MNIPLDGTKARILATLKSRGALNSAQIATLIGRTQDTVQTYLCQLKDRGLVREAGRDTVHTRAGLRWVTLYAIAEQPFDALLAAWPVPPPAGGLPARLVHVKWREE